MMFSLSLQSLYSFSNYIIFVTPLFLSVPVCLYMLCGTWRLAEHSIFHDSATLKSCFDTPLTQNERIATHSQSLILSLFLLFLLPLVPFPPSLPVTVNLNACKHRQLKMHHR